MIDEDIKKTLAQDVKNQPDIGHLKKKTAKKKIPIVLVVIPFIIFFGILAKFPVERANISLQYPFQLDAEEGFLLNQAILINLNQPIYKSIKLPPYIVSNYGPIYPYLFSKMIKSKGPRIEIGRVLSISMMFGILVAVIFIILFKGKSLASAILAPLLVLVTYEVYDWIPYARVDTLAILFSLLGIMAVSVEDNATSRVIALFFFLAAFFTKANQIAAPVATILYLLIRDTKKGIRWLHFFILFILIISCILTIKTRGEFFRHTILYNANQFDLWQLKRLFNHLCRFQVYLLICSAFIFILEIISAFTKYFKDDIVKTDFSFFNYLRYSLKQIDIIYFYYFFVMLTFFEIAKIGSSSNYLIEIHIVVSLLICLKLAQSIYHITYKRWTKNIALLPAFLWLIIIIGFLGLHSINVFNKSIGFPSPVFNINNIQFKDWKYVDTYQEMLNNKGILFNATNPTTIDLKNCEKIVDLVLNTSGPIFSEEPIFNIYAGKRVEIQPFIMSQLAKEKKWNQNDLVDKFKKGYFTLIIANSDLLFAPKNHFYDRYTEEMIKAIRSRYYLYTDFNTSARTHYYVYAPRKIDSKKFNFNIAQNNYLYIGETLLGYSKKT